MIRLEFINFLNDHRLVGRFNTHEEANAAIVKELNSKGIKPYYYRYWEEEEEGEKVTVVDFGSHSEFYKKYEEGK